MESQVTDSDCEIRTQHSDFARRVLDLMPSPVLVVDGTATVIYANDALLDLIGRVGQTAAGENILDYIHPDDVEWLAEAFVDLTQADPVQDSGALPSIHVRIISATGETVPVEVTGARSISDEVVGGVIYDVRPARHHDLLTHLLAGVASGANVVDLLRLVTQLIAMPPLTLDAAVLERDGDGWKVVTCTSLRLAAALVGADPSTFTGTSHEPHRCDKTELGDALCDRIASAGYADTWRLSVAGGQTIEGDERTRYEIITCNTRRQRLSPGVADRMSQARELAGIVMLRAENDKMLQHTASHDSLTGLLNRSAFRERLGAALCDDMSTPEAREMSVIFLDLDGFKPINDSFGHAAGDEVLGVVASRLTVAVRSSDAVARLGGDEFAVLLGSDGTGLDAQHAIAARIVESIGAPISVGTVPGEPVTVQVTASAGFAALRPGDNVDDVLKRADRLMYEAKRSGGGRAQS